MHFLFKEVTEEAYHYEEHYRHMVNVMIMELKKLKLKHGNGANASPIEPENNMEMLGIGEFQVSTE